MAGKAVAKKQTAEVVKHRVDMAVEEIGSWVNQTTGTEATNEILAGILDAESPEELYGDDEDIVSSKDFIDIAFKFSEWSVVKSDRESEDGCPYYFSLLSHHGTRTFRINTGGWQSVFALYTEIKKGWWNPDIAYRFHAIETRGKNTVVVLRRD